LQLNYGDARRNMGKKASIQVSRGKYKIHIPKVVFRTWTGHAHAGGGVTNATAVNKSTYPALKSRILDFVAKIVACGTAGNRYLDFEFADIDSVVVKSVGSSQVVIASETHWLNTSPAEGENVRDLITEHGYKLQTIGGIHEIPENIISITMTNNNHKNTDDYMVYLLEEITVEWVDIYINNVKYRLQPGSYDFTFDTDTVVSLDGSYLDDAVTAGLTQTDIDNAFDNSNVSIIDQGFYDPPVERDDFEVDIEALKDYICPMCDERSCQCYLELEGF
jgi:hypothetical protein